METTHTPQRALIKLLAIVGFFVLIAFIIWAIVQGVRAFPSVFSSLANIAETVNEYRPAKELSLTLGKNIVNSGETFTLTWNDMGKGTYTFTYECADDIRLLIRTGNGEQKELECSETLELPDHVRGLFVTVEAKEQRFSDAAFTVTFEKEDGEAIEKEGHVTIVNATVPQDGDPVAEEEPKEETPVTPAPKPTPKPTPAPTPAPKPVTTIVYPVSDPNGFTDLKVTYLDAGTVINGIYVMQSSFDEDKRAAFRFEVQNIGTKTSDTWSYELELPEGVEYTSGSQLPLGPQARVIFTVGFEIDDDSDSSVSFEGTIDTNRDSNSKNDSFSKTIKVTD